MKVALFYFSGTGNTELTVKKWKDEAAKFDIAVDLIKIEKDNFDLNIYDVLVPQLHLLEIIFF